MIRRTSEVGALRSCHVVFLPASEINHFREVSSGLGNLSVLLVGETEGFAEGGGVINFIVRKDYRGAEVTGYYATPTRGGPGPDGSQSTFKVAAGFGDLAKDRFNVFVAAAAMVSVTKGSIVS